MPDRDDLAADFREFAREMILRLERSIDSLIDDLRVQREAQRAESRAYFEALHAEMREHDERERRRIEEVAAEGRAQRQALFRMLDRLGNGGPEAAT